MICAHGWRLIQYRYDETFYQFRWIFIVIQLRIFSKIVCNIKEVNSFQKQGLNLRQTSTTTVLSDSLSSCLSTLEDD